MILTESDRGPLLRWTNWFKPTETTHTQIKARLCKKIKRMRCFLKNTTCKQTIRRILQLLSSRWRWKQSWKQFNE